MALVVQAALSDAAVGAIAGADGIDGEDEPLSTGCHLATPSRGLSF